VGVGGYGMHAISNNGIAWEEHNLTGAAATHAANGLIYDPTHGAFVTGDDSSVLAYAPDGKAWVLSTGTKLPTGGAELAAGNGVIVAASGTATVLSTDGGMTWTAGGALPIAVQALVFAQGHFTGMGADHVFTSNDGVVWTNHPITIDGHTMAYGHGVYILFNNQSYRRSTDGISWVATKSLGGSNGINWVTFGPSG
jgi:hypothetical protein